MGVPCCANYPASQSILPNSQTVTMLLCTEQLYRAPKRKIARPSKTQGRATQDIQSSMHPARANLLRTTDFQSVAAARTGPDGLEVRRT